MQSDKNTAYLLLGSNLGDRELLIASALNLIGERVGEISLKSALYETEAWGKTDQPGFLNVAVAVTTQLLPLQLMETVLAIELELGRVRHQKWGSRLIDIDIIFYGNEIVSIADRLQIPHPEMQNRKFVLVPLAEIAEELVHPVLKLTIKKLLAKLTDQSVVLVRS